MEYRRRKKFIFLAVLLLATSMLFLIFSLLSATRSKGNIILSALNYFVDCCVLYFNKIAAFIVLEKITLAYLGLAFLAYGLVEGIINLLSGSRKVKKLRENLEIVKRFNYGDNITVNIFSADNISVAFTMGLLNPEIYISTGLYRSLNEEEIKSVIAHEVHHVKERDPFKIVVLRFIEDIFFFIPILKHLLRRFEEAMEKSADDFAMVTGGNEFSLASALLKVKKSGGRIIPVATFADIDSEGLIESRVLRLIEPNKDKKRIIPRGVLTTTALLYLALLVSAFTFPESLFTKRTGECLHSEKGQFCTKMTPEECRKHCEQLRFKK